jgi:hypothetical protein
MSNETKTDHFDIPRQIREDPTIAAIIRNGAIEGNRSVIGQVRHLIMQGIEHERYCAAKRGYVRERPGPVRARPELSGERTA